MPHFSLFNCCLKKSLHLNISSQLSVGVSLPTVFDRSKFPQEFTVYSHLYFSDNMTDAIHLFDRELNIFVTEYSFPLTKINDMVMLVPRTEGKTRSVGVLFLICLFGCLLDLGSL